MLFESFTPVGVTFNNLVYKIVEGEILNHLI